MNADITEVRQAYAEHGYRWGQLTGDAAHHTHKFGFQMDIKYLTNSGEIQSGAFYNKGTDYNQALTQELIGILLSTQTDHASVAYIYYNDQQIIDYFDDNGYQYMVQQHVDHDSHMHVCFQILDPVSGDWTHR